jgi:hypothetical protein
MSTPKDGGPAFPRSWGTATDDGMSLRDYFAAKAMAAMLSNEATCIRLSERSPDLKVALADNAYHFADAMLAERAKEKP